jgi:uncharacterized damage-inducible protein DinB
MSNPLTERFRRWFDYERDAHAKVFASLETVSPEGRDTAEYRKAVSVLAHIVAARRIWLGRIGRIPLTSGPLFPTNLTAADVAAQWNEVSSAWTGYLDELDDAALERVLEYQSLDSVRFRNRLEEILTQLFGHSSYHRGQIASLVKLAGGQPAITDFIYWCREPVGGS